MTPTLSSLLNVLRFSVKRSEVTLSDDNTVIRPQNMLASCNMLHNVTQCYSEFNQIWFSGRLHQLFTDNFPSGLLHHCRSV